jgi:hypothetical protein
MLRRAAADLRARDLIEVGLCPDQSGQSRDRHLQLMLWLSYACIGLGFFVLNWTLSSYLLGSGLLDYADHPWKTYAFSSLPITAAITLKATASLFTERTRRRFAMLLGLTGGIASTLAWSASFAWLFGPQSVSAMALPGDGITIDQWIGKALVFTHIIGETGCAAVLGFWAEKLWQKNRKRAARATEESERGRADIREAFEELEAIEGRKRDELDYQQRFGAGLKAFTAKVAARYDAELTTLQARQATAIAQFVVNPSASS